MLICPRCGALLVSRKDGSKGAKCSEPDCGYGKASTGSAAEFLADLDERLKDHQPTIWRIASRA